MNSVVKFELIKKREELHEELIQLQEEIDILSLLLKRMQKEYDEIDSKIKKDRWLTQANVIGIY